MVNEDLCLLQAPLNVVGKDGRAYAISTLTDARARTHADRLLELHNLIPHVSWTDDDLLAEADRAKRREYRGKWSLSLCAFHDGRPVALLVAYLRNDNVRRGKPGLYLHRLAVAPEHQRNRLGTHMAEAAIDAYFRIVPGLKAITVQTNNEAANEGVIGFYRSLGFKRCDTVKYPDKEDLLLRIRPPLGLGRRRSPHGQNTAAAQGCLNQSAAFTQHLAALLPSPTQGRALVRFLRQLAHSKPARPVRPQLRWMYHNARRVRASFVAR